ncbi:response regulator [Nakamurella sp.]|uniref:response regulator n=1 Tax=Nakamurella sp. TaxID=1869182 RepID=UPI003B3A4A09
MRIALAEDEALFRQGLGSLLRASGHEIVVSAADAEQLLAEVVDARPDLVITDIRMPPTHTSEGLTAAIRIRRLMPDVAVVLLSHHVDAQGTVELLTAGGHRIGYLLKQRVLDFEMFAGVLERVQAGESVIDPEVVASALTARRERRAVDSLTPRRLDVLTLMAQGYSNARIARELVVTEAAVARNIALIFETLGLPQDPDIHRRVLAVIEYLNR